MPWASGPYETVIRRDNTFTVLDGSIERTIRIDAPTQAPGLNNNNHVNTYNDNILERQPLTLKNETLQTKNNK